MGGNSAVEYGRKINVSSSTMKCNTFVGIESMTLFARGLFTFLGFAWIRIKNEQYTRTSWFILFF